MPTSSKLWIFAAFLLVAGYVASFVYWYQQVLQVEAAPPKVGSAQLSDVATTNISNIAKLFGAPPEKDSSDVKASPLSFKLVASYVVPGKGRSAAIISTDGDNQKLYYVGDKIQRDVELRAVQAGRILIKRNGALESISLDAFSGSGVVMAEDKPAPPSKAVVSVPVVDTAKSQDMLEKLKKLKSLAARDN